MGKDKDKDGTLSEEELRLACDGMDAATINSMSEAVERNAGVKRLFSVLDKNADGRIVASEFLEFMRGALGSSSATLAQAEKSMAFKDKDKDGTLSGEELKLACDGMDAATINSMSEAVEKNAGVKRLFSVLDKNAD